MIRSDVANYYASMQHELVLEHVRGHISSPQLIKIFSQYLNRVEVWLGHHTLVKTGIVKGCSLSPLIGALMLKRLDRSVMHNTAYIRYMDDWVILTNSSCKLRRLVKTMHNTISSLHFKLAPDKTYIGKTTKAFDFLGFKFDNRGVIGVGDLAFKRHITKVTALYEQSCSKDKISNYKKHWRTWSQIGLKHVSLTV